MKYKLYGDGINDDTYAIQELIDSGVNEIILPAPEKHYLISRPLELPSNFRLVLPRFAEIRLAANSNCVMVRNKMVRDYKKRMKAEVYEKPVTAQLWGYIDNYSPDAPCRNIELCGGIWNCNNQNQLPNPERGMSFSAHEFYGCGMLFYNVSYFKLSSLTIKDPSQYAVTLDTVSYFTVDDITFDFNKGNPYPVNMDGIHLDGNCHYGVINNLKGTCYDDMVALNAHEGSRGPITNISIKGLFAEYCHSAVRLLTVSEAVENIHISDVYGSFYQYCVGITKHYREETTGYFDGITLENIHASKAMPVEKGDFKHPPVDNPENSLHLIWIQSLTVVKSLAVKGWHRREKTVSQELIRVNKDALVNRMILDDITSENHTGKPMPILHNMGKIKYLSVRNLDSSDGNTILNEGSIEKYSE